MKRICHFCKKPHSRAGKWCPACLKVKAAHKNEAIRQETRLMMRGWMPR